METLFNRPLAAKMLKKYPKLTITIILGLFVTPLAIQRFTQQTNQEGMKLKEERVYLKGIEVGEEKAKNEFRKQCVDSLNANMINVDKNQKIELPFDVF
jgi:hypothetical protein